MENKSVLTVSSEVLPYWQSTEISEMSYKMPKMVFENGGDIRIFMPKFGNINERKYQLHEVIRLSGANLVINDTDMLLLIKVASIPKERIQVYFIDNEDCFKRKEKYTDAKGKLFKDNDERIVFFTKGVLETIKKLNWRPDIIHLHGWMTSLFPVYLRKYYEADPLLSKMKIVTSVYANEFEGSINKGIIDKLEYDKISQKQVPHLSEATDYSSFIKTAIDNSDGVTICSENVSPEMLEYISKVKENHLGFKTIMTTPKSLLDYYQNL